MITTMTTPARRWWLIFILLLLLLAAGAWLLWRVLGQPGQASPANGPTGPTISSPLPTPTVATSLPATPTSLPTATAVVLPAPTATATTPAATTPACSQNPAARWANTLYAEFGERLGCPLSGEVPAAGEVINAAFQYYERGLMVWRQDMDLIYVLAYGEDAAGGAFVAVPDASPAGYYESDLVKGGFGYLWSNNEMVRNMVGSPLVIEYFAAEFAAQAFDRGTIFTFFDNGRHQYLLFAGEGEWVYRQAE
jgi:hypothetical protein